MKTLRHNVNKNWGIEQLRIRVQPQGGMTYYEGKACADITTLNLRLKAPSQVISTYRTLLKWRI